MSPTFLTLDEVLVIHQDQIERYGGSPGVRDAGLLESAISQPMATFGRSFLHADLPTMASAYLFHIAKDHPFLDGNKRAALATALVFLTINDCEIDAPGDEVLGLVIGVADGSLGKEQVAEFIRDHLMNR